MDKVLKNLIRKSGEGFTLIEILIAITILIIMTAIAVPYFYSFQKEADLNSSAEKIISIIRIAQNKTRAAEQGSQWGVHFLIPSGYELFKGSSYISAEEIYTLSDNIEIYDISLAGGGSDIIFNKLSADTNQFGSISIRLKNDIAKTKQISIQSSGQASVSAENLPADTDRITDSRHVHFDYSRAIDANSEELTLIIDSISVPPIKIFDNMQGGQIYWEGEIDGQKIKIHTHRLNNSDTQFCVHRDGYNDKSLEIKISGDSSGSLIKYDANGQIIDTGLYSIYLSNLVWQ